MKTANAIKRLEKHGQVLRGGSLYRCRIGDYVVKFFDSHGEAHGIGFHHIGDNDDIQSDYFATIYTRSLASAIAICVKNLGAGVQS